MALHTVHSPISLDGVRVEPGREVELDADTAAQLNAVTPGCVAPAVASEPLKAEPPKAAETPKPATKKGKAPPPPPSEPAAKVESPAPPPPSPTAVEQLLAELAAATTLEQVLDLEEKASTTLGDVSSEDANRLEAAADDALSRIEAAAAAGDPPTT